MRSISLPARGALVLILAGAVVPSGCGVELGRGGRGPAPGPASGSASTSASTSAPGHAASGVANRGAGADAAAIAATRRTHEYGSGPPRAQATAGWWSTPQGAIRAFANAYINWNAGNVLFHLRVLAAVSVGAARSSMDMQRARAAGDYELRRSGLANQGVLEAVAPAPDAPDAFIVVTRERTTSASPSFARELPPAWHVTVAQAAELTPGHWVVSSWQPES